jgi:hypothetical protein
MAIETGNVYDRARRETAAAEYLTSPEFPAIQADAAKRGHRKATIGEIHASAERTPFAPDVYCWRGGLWIKN